MSNDEYYKGVKIEKLPTIGSSLSIKTLKQGRQVSLGDIAKDRVSVHPIYKENQKNKIVKKKKWKKKLNRY